MPFSILFFVHRKPGTSIADFQNHYENRHIPLIRSLAGHHFPTFHIRRYLRGSDITKDSSDNSEAVSTPAHVLVGTQSDFDYDVVGEWIFENESAFEACFAKLGEEDAARRIADDEERFIDRERTRAAVLSERVVSSRSDHQDVSSAQTMDG